MTKLLLQVRGSRAAVAAFKREACDGSAAQGGAVKKRFHGRDISAKKASIPYAARADSYKS